MRYYNAERGNLVGSNRYLAHIFHWSNQFSPKYAHNGN